MEEFSTKLLLDHIKKAEEDTIWYAHQQALKRGSGTYSRKRLAKLGHPYAVRNKGKTEITRYGKTRLAIPYGDPGMINKQSGRFNLSWNLGKASLKGDNLETSLTNTAPYADDLARGARNKTVIPRPLLDKVVDKAKYWRERNLILGIKRALEEMR